jgi:hypothetical protein
MSEYQYIAFRAIDAPVSEENLPYMRRQSSRAEITPWSFQNEYDFGEFRGNAPEMLRRGYDFHLHYANFGVRTLMIRFPSGLPDVKSAKPYFKDDAFGFSKDKKGAGGILKVEPYYDAGDLDDVFELDDLLHRLLPLRAEILNGDLRPLYLAHLAIATDAGHDPAEVQDAPVPAGLEKLTDTQQALAELYGLSRRFIAAAAKGAPQLPTQPDSIKAYAKWLRNQTEKSKTAWLCDLMSDPQSTVRRTILAEYQKDSHIPAWPTSATNRTVAEIKAAAREI